MAIKASSDDTRCAATRREVNVHTSSTFKEQQLLKQAQTKSNVKVVDRLARLKIDRYKLVGEDKLLVKQCIFQEQVAPLWRGQLWCLNL